MADEQFVFVLDAVGGVLFGLELTAHVDLASGLRLRGRRRGRGFAVGCQVEDRVASVPYADV